VGVSRIGPSLIPGEFVEFKGLAASAAVISLTLRTDSTTFLWPNDFLDEMSAEVQSCSTGLNPIEYRYMTDDVKEVIVTDSLEWVHSDGIYGIAFVFHVDSINDQIYPCNGMANAYFVCQ
jgi:hypothetical protein